MKNSYIVLIVVLLVAVALFFGFKSKNLEAPAQVDNSAAGGTQLTESERPDGEGDTLDTSMDLEVTNPNFKEFNIKGVNFDFEPKVITVKKGDRVKINFENSAGFHDFVIEEYGVATKKTQAPTLEVIEFTADKAGTFEYYCSVGSHRAMGMVGTLKVE